MVQKEFTSPDGYLIVDVFSEVLKELGEHAESWRTAQRRFNDVLMSAPKYFNIFRMSIKVKSNCGWSARKGQRMVSLVQNTDR
jgi:hypothetical protein